MEDTCQPERCKLHDLLGGDQDQCPNHLLSTWVSKDGVTKAVHDCAPKRTLLMLQQMENRMLGLQKAQEEQRNESRPVNLLLAKALRNRFEVKQNGAAERLEGPSSRG